jgi:predicted DsbA family dithiol-disulfide isomerase
MNAAVVLQAAAGQPAWWRLAGRLMGRPPPAGEKRLLATAAEAGLDTAPLRRALQRPAHQLAALEANQQAARALEVRGSPYLFVAGRPIPGATSYERIERMIAAALAGRAPAGGTDSRN